MNRWKSAAPLAAVLCASFPVSQAAPPQAQGTLVAQEEASCRKEVRDYVNALRFVRDSSGNGIGSRVEQVFINEKDLNQVVADRGACAAAQLLRAKGLPR